MNANPHWKIDFHCHSRYSADSRSELKALIRRAKEIGLDRLVLTDHNTIRGALAAREMESDYVIVGEEILTTRGELLAFFVEKEIPRGLQPEEAIARLREQGAFVSVSHPFDLQRHGWRMNDLEAVAPLVDAVEVFNARSILHKTNEQAARFAQERNLLGTAGSDAHLLGELGRTVMQIAPFTSAEELRAALPCAIIQAKYSSIFVHFGSTLAKLIR